MYKFLSLYLLALNLITFFIMYIDKQKAIKHQWRISEKTLILSSIIGGSIGTLLGMHFFKHKTKHLKFTLGIPCILIIQILLFTLLFIL